MYAFKSVIKRKNPHHNKLFKDLQKQIKNKKPVKVPTKKGTHAFMFMMSDWQLGKKDYGSLNTVKYIRQAIVKAQKEIRNLNKLGQTIDEIYLIGLGDLIENCFGFFEHQPFSIELTKVEQEHLTRVMILEILDGLLNLAPKIILGGVAGNHGENRSGKRAISTTRLDNSDTAQIQIVGEIIQGRERYKHVKVVVPDDYHLVLEIKGKNVAFTHGHMTGGGGDSWAKIEKWWKGQMYGWLPSGSAHILVTGHYHHFRAVEQRGRLWLQSPALDDSLEFQARSGYATQRGVLTFTISKDGWSNVCYYTSGASRHCKLTTLQP